MCVGVGVEDADLGDPVERQVVAERRPPDRLRAWRLVKAEHRSGVLVHVGVHPRDPVIRVPLDNRLDRKLRQAAKRALDEVAWHSARLRVVAGDRIGRTTQIATARYPTWARARDAAPP